MPAHHRAIASLQQRAPCESRTRLTGLEDRVLAARTTVRSGRLRSDSNRCRRCCRPPPSHSDTEPSEEGGGIEPSGTSRRSRDAGRSPKATSRALRHDPGFRDPLPAIQRRLPARGQGADLGGCPVQGNRSHSVRVAGQQRFERCSSALETDCSPRSTDPSCQGGRNRTCVDLVPGQVASH